MSVVYVVQDQRRFDRETGELVPAFPDLRARAAEHGEVRFLLSPSAGPWNAASVVRDLRAGLAGYRDGDHLLLVGNPVLIGLAVAVASDVNRGRVSMLQWSGKEKRYLAVSAQAKELPPEEPPEPLSPRGIDRMKESGR